MQGASVMEALIYYLIRLVMFSVVAAVGIVAGIKLRKYKNEKQQTTESEN